MQLRLDAADRLVELVGGRRGPLYAEEAARRLFALRHVPAGLARGLLDDVVAGDARLAWSGDSVRLATPPGHDLLLERATYVVVDLETTGLRPGSSRICEIGAVRIRDLELAETFQTLANPGLPLGRTVSALTGLSDAALRRAPPPAAAVRRFLAFAGNAVLVAHNARFDLAFLDRETERLTGKRLAAPVVDTVALARRVLGGRVARASLASLAYFFGTSVRPCHRALPDAQATAEVLLALIGLAQERGATTVADLCELERIEWRRLGSELEAGLEELRLIRELRPPANARSARPDRYVYLRRRGDSVVCSTQPTELGPLTSRRRAQVAARALQGVEWETLDDALPKLREKLKRLARDLRFEDAARLRDRIVALEDAAREIRRMEQLRRMEVCLVAGGRAIWVAKGQVVCIRPWGGTSGLEWQAGAPGRPRGRGAPPPPGRRP